MGLLVEGKWVEKQYVSKQDKGRFKRSESHFRNWVTSDGAAGPSGTGGFEAEAGRYHLYVSYACPWAHRTLVLRKLKRMEELVSVSVVHWFLGDDGWTFADGDGVIPDTVNGAKLLREVYLKADPHVTSRVSVPVLWDKANGTIVSNESSEIIRMFNSAFDGIGARADNYYPEDLREQIDAINERVYDTLNNGVYKCGFATTQEAYDEAVEPLFDTLDWLEDKLGGGRYLLGDRMTEADWRLWTTLLRFDPVYHGHFKCNLRRIVDYPNLSNYVRDLYQHEDVAATVRLDHIKTHYYGSHLSINPTGIVPRGPVIDYGAPHDRARFAS